MGLFSAPSDSIDSYRNTAFGRETYKTPFSRDEYNQLYGIVEPKPHANQ